MEHEKGLLEGIVILDLTRVLAGPYCGALLADMGATVIKVEQPGKGDDSRSMGPFINDQSVYFANFNRSKMGVTLNLKAPEAKEIFKEMVKKADVVIENYRPGTMEKLGLGYDVLKEINPGIIYGACSGFGHTGPYSKRAGYDIVGQAMGGLMSTTGWPGGPATRCGTPMGDVLGGLNLTVGVLAAFKIRHTPEFVKGRLKGRRGTGGLCGLRYGEYHHDLSVYRPYPPADRQPL